MSRSKSYLTFWSHIEELRKLLIRSGCVLLCSTVLCFYFHKPCFRFLLASFPLEKVYLFHPLEGFACVAKFSIWLGIVLASPLWTYSLLKFITPALKPEEKKLMIPFIALSVLFIGTGILFAYYFTIPITLKFFCYFNQELGENLWSLSQTVDLILSLILAHGVIFELYVLILLLIQCQVLGYSLLRKGRKGIIVAIFVLSAILTPPDVLSQLLLALPMLLLFESALLFARYKERKRLIGQTHQC